MPLEFALRPRFDLKRPAPRRRLAWLRLHPLVLPIGAYWLAAAGLTYALVRSASVNVADAAEPPVEPDAAPVAPPSWSEPPVGPSDPIAALPPAADSDPHPVERAPEPEPEPAPLSEDWQDEPIARTDFEPPARLTPEPRKPPSHSVLPRSVEDEPLPQRWAVEPEPVEEPEEPRRELASALPPKPDRSREAPTGPMPSCEAAAAAANQIIEVGSTRGAPDLTRGAFAGVLEHGAYLAPCSIPPRTALEICAAVQNGNVVGVTVTTEPRDSAIDACVRRAVTKLRFPRSPQVDVTRTRFERVR